MVIHMKEIITIKLQLRKVIEMKKYNYLLSLTLILSVVFFSNSFAFDSSKIDNANYELYVQFKDTGEIISIPTQQSSSKSVRTNNEPAVPAVSFGNERTRAAGADWYAQGETNFISDSRSNTSSSRSFITDGPGAILGMISYMTVNNDSYYESGNFIDSAFSESPDGAFVGAISAKVSVPKPANIYLVNSAHYFYEPGYVPISLTRSTTNPYM